MHVNFHISSFYGDKEVHAICTIQNWAFFLKALKYTNVKACLMKRFDIICVFRTKNNRKFTHHLHLDTSFMPFRCHLKYKTMLSQNVKKSHQILLSMIYHLTNYVIDCSFVCFNLHECKIYYYFKNNIVYVQKYFYASNLFIRSLLCEQIALDNVLTEKTLFPTKSQ